MEPVIYNTPEKTITGGSFWDSVTAIPQTIESRVPTLDRSLDAYFDRHFARIIEEWDLVTESDLHALETRLARVTDEITGMYAAKVATDARVEALDALITTLEAQR
ncbi:MAG: hypothetical protein GYA23_11810 [Methanomicrobiales archaeon]|nr:hypothetical protein [Methanomicrobiales archaeon]